MLFLILIDGLNYEIYKRLLNEDRLPNIKKYLMDGLSGVWCEALTTFPSATAPSLPELLTGRYSYWHQRMPRKIHAFDRERMETYRYEFMDEAWVNELGDLFQLMKKYCGQVLSSFKGSFKESSNSFYSEFLYNLDAITDFSSLDLFNYDEIVTNEIIRILEKQHEEYGMVFLYLTTTDLNGHFHGIHDTRYANSIIEIDRHLGTLFSHLIEIPDKNGGNLFENSHFFLFGDHGMVSTGNYIDLASIFQAIRIPSLDLSRVFALLRNKLWSNWAQGLDLLILPGGSSIAELYIRNYNSYNVDEWKNFPSIDLLYNYPVRTMPQFHYNILMQLAAIQGIDVIMIEESADVFLLLSPRTGKSRIYRKGEMTSYRYLYHAFTTNEYLQGDPLGYLSDPHAGPMVCTDPYLTRENVFDKRYDEYFFTLPEWLSATFHTLRPLAVPLIPKAFSDSNTRSDIIVTSRPGFNFMKLSKGDHGDLIRDSIMTPLIMAGKKINPQVQLSNVRLIDLYPTLMRLMRIPEHELPEHLDGRIIPNLLINESLQ